MKLLVAVPHNYCDCETRVMYARSHSYLDCDHSYLVLPKVSCSKAFQIEYCKLEESFYYGL